MNNCFLALGSNINRPQYQISVAIKAIRKIPRTQVLKIATFYQNPAMGRKVQPEFCNTVIKIRTGLDPQSLLYFCSLIEKKQGRLRKVKNGARTIDIDILIYGARKIRTSTLTIPHPEMKNRDFVLIPLKQIWTSKPRLSTRKDEVL